MNITFSLYDVGAGGVPLWTATQAVSVNHGVLSVQLGDPLTPFPVAWFQNQLWLGIAVEGDAEMFPRQPLNAVGFAYVSQQAENDADTLGSLSCAPGTIAKYDGTGWVCAPDEFGSSDWNSLLNVPPGFADGIDNDTITTSFADLTDTATDAQIPNNITIDQAANANTVDTLHASRFPVPGQLFALDGGGKFPNSTLIMGQGSGLDADTVDGWHASEFSLVSHWHNYLNAADGNPASALFVDASGNVGIGTTAPEFTLHVNGLAKFELSQGSIAMSTPGGNPGMITFAPNGNRRDITITNAGLSLTVSSTSSAPSLTNGIFIADNGRIGVGSTNPAARLEVRGEVRTTSSSGVPRLWGQGRPGAVRYGTTGAESGLCLAGATQFGLSFAAVPWGYSETACPAGTWVCTRDDISVGPGVSISCDTARPDNPTGPDAVTCGNGSVNYGASNHYGWLADTGSTITSGYVKGEAETAFILNAACASNPVWCCSGPN